MALLSNKLSNRSHFIRKILSMQVIDIHLRAPSNINYQPKCGAEKENYLSLTLRHGSIDSSLAAMLATQPFVTLLRYTIGVLPINYIHLVKRRGFKHKPLYTPQSNFIGTIRKSLYQNTSAYKPSPRQI